MALENAYYCFQIIRTVECYSLAFVAKAAARYAYEQDSLACGVSLLRLAHKPLRGLK